MSNQNLNNPPKKKEEGLVKTAKMIYFLNLVSLVIGITSIVAVVMAYIYKTDDNPQWINSHFRWQIRTFWIGFIAGFISVLLCIILIGYLLLIGLLVWWIIRNVKGLKWLSEQKPVENVTTYFF
ncbi:MAG: hypothetical protein Q9M37_01100 [Desulfonauticus sp.]|nr:hypothetical protein [Desulfonauticus sp.]